MVERSSRFCAASRASISRAFAPCFPRATSCAKESAHSPSPSPSMTTTLRTLGSRERASRSLPSCLPSSTTASTAPLLSRM